MRRLAAFPPHPLRTRFSKEQLKLSSGGGVAIITFSNETFQDASGNPIAIKLFKGAHMIAVTLTESRMIRIYNPSNHALKPIEIGCRGKYVNTKGDTYEYDIEK